MPTLIEKPTEVVAAGTKRSSSKNSRARRSKTQVSASRGCAVLQAGRSRGKRGFDEFSIVLSGALRVAHKTRALDVRAGQAVIARGGEWVQYSTPEGAEYISVCLPAFSPATVHRD